MWLQAALPGRKHTLFFFVEETQEEWPRYSHGVRQAILQLNTTPGDYPDIPLNFMFVLSLDGTHPVPVVVCTCEVACMHPSGMHGMAAPEERYVSVPQLHCQNRSSNAISEPICSCLPFHLALLQMRHVRWCIAIPAGSKWGVQTAADAASSRSAMLPASCSKLQKCVCTAIEPSGLQKLSRG